MKNLTKKFKNSATWILLLTLVAMCNCEESLARLSGVEFPGYASDVASSGYFAYVLEDGYGLWAVDIKDSTRPKIVGKIKIKNTGGRIVTNVQDNSLFLYITRRKIPGVLIVNATNPLKMTIHETIGTNLTDPLSLTVFKQQDETIVAVSDIISGLSLLGGTTVLNTNSTVSVGMTHDKTTNRIYTADLTKGFMVLDALSLNTLATQRMSFHNHITGYSISTDSKGTVYMTTGQGGLSVFRVTTENKIREIHNVTTKGSTRGLAVAGNMVLVTDRYKGLLLFSQIEGGEGAVHHTASYKISGNTVQTALCCGNKVALVVSQTSEHHEGLILVDVKKFVNFTHKDNSNNDTPTPSSSSISVLSVTLLILACFLILGVTLLVRANRGLAKREMEEGAAGDEDMPSGGAERFSFSDPGCEEKDDAGSADEYTTVDLNQTAQGIGPISPRSPQADDDDDDDNDTVQAQS